MSLSNVEARKHLKHRHGVNNTANQRDGVAGFAAVEKHGPGFCRLGKFQLEPFCPGVYMKLKEGFATHVWSPSGG